MSSIPMTNIKTTHIHDVLCGRGGRTYKHVGNYTYRHLISLNKPAYVTCKKFEKMKISRSIVDAIRKQDPPGRFLAFDKQLGIWNDVGDMKAIEKTSQALRERQPDIREKIMSIPENPSLLSQLYNQSNQSIGNWLNNTYPTKNESPNIWNSSTYTRSEAFNYTAEKPLVRKLCNEEGKEHIEFVSSTNGSNKRPRKEMNPLYFLIRSR